MMDKTVAFHTLGCRLNSSETAGIARGFMPKGATASGPLWQGCRRGFYQYLHGDG